MRGNRKIFTTLAAVAVIGATLLGSPAPSAAPAAPHATWQQDLQARRAQLMAQLQSLIANEKGASAQLVAAEQQLQQSQNQLLALQNQLAATNDRLGTLSQEITRDHAIDATAQKQLAVLTRATFESSSNSTVLVAILSSQSFSDAMSRMRNADSVRSQVEQLQAQLLDNEKQIATDRAALQSQFAQASTLERQVSDANNQFLIVVEQRDEALASASAPVRDIESQIANIDNQLASGQQYSSAPTVSGSSCPDRFAFGQCTWYVASRRCIPWSGNADQWYGNAARMGFLEGHAPAVGAVVVFWPGGDGASSVGHVAYVEAVGPAPGTASYPPVPAGEFEISEMNFAGWDRVSFRTIADGSSGVQGFIYGHS